MHKGYFNVVEEEIRERGHELAEGIGMSAAQVHQWKKKRQLLVYQLQLGEADTNILQGKAYGVRIYKHCSRTNRTSIENTPPTSTVFQILTRSCLYSVSPCNGASSRLMVCSSVM